MRNINIPGIIKGTKNYIKEHKVRICASKCDDYYNHRFGFKRA